MRWMMLCIAACWLALSATPSRAGENCKVCHRVTLEGVHARLSCLSCHLSESATLANPAAAAGGAVGCAGCHKGYARLFEHAMGTRDKERRFVEGSIGRFDAGFFENRCGSCHLAGCTDCHGGSGHRVARASDRSCFACHRGYFVGTDYYGMAPREDSLRYQRGEQAYGQSFLKMTPDVHAEAGLSCAACHSMASLVAGAKSSKGCLDCHRVNTKVVEHRIAAHLEKMECYACHSAWAAQEYGTFWLRFTDSSIQEDFEVKENAGNYVKSAYLRKQDAPPLGINAAGKVSPIRPQFLLYFSEILNDRPVGSWSRGSADLLENRLLAAQWKAFFPHTIRRGTVMCEGCHDTPRRYLLEPPQDRIYQLQADGMTLASFWERSGQRVVNGDFLPMARYQRVTARTKEYQRAYLEKWQQLITHVEASSSP
ncbi:cytochrome c [Geomonas limicola]|uniref:Cytochrome c n=1 Tax=Geomonas limicola TaxID=2740186 RepID=A0A6V8N9N8_9BACT|nr:selenite/tellurite reduction operon b-type cytochrome iron-sulfur cluster-binding subunit ExtO [Geomonas limicola]GFO69278.1 cytochrome c [Geomonas limicola]